MWFCKGASTAQKRYQRSLMRLMGCYVVILFGASYLVHRHHFAGWPLYVCSVLPAIPIIAVIVRVGAYLREETDEYQRLLKMQTILVGTGALLSAVMVNDFLRVFASFHGIGPFWEFMIFCTSMGLTGAWQSLRDRVPAGE